MVTLTVTDTGVQAVGPDTATAVVTADGWSADDPSHELPRAAVDSVGGVTTGLKLLPGVIRLRRLDSETERKLAAPVEGTVQLPAAPYLLCVEGAVTIFIRFDGEATMTGAGGDPLLSFSDCRRVTVGVGDRSERPETVTVSQTPEGVATALSVMSAGHLTATPDRSRPEMRASPPRIEFGSVTTIPDSVAARNPDSAVVFELPPSLDYLVPASSLAHYLGAEIRVADGADVSPTLRTATLEHEFEPNPRYQSAVASLLRRVFLLDCLVRGADSNGRDVAEMELLDEVGLDADSLSRSDIDERLEAYLDAPFAEISDRLPDWHLSMYVSPSYDRVRTLPYLLQNVPNIFLPEAKPLGTDERLSRSLDDFYRADNTAADEETAGNTRATKTVPGVTPVKPVLGPGRVHGWLADGVPIDVFKSISSAYEHRARYPANSQSLSVVAVLNDRRMIDESTDAARIYESAPSELDLDVTVKKRITRAELAAVFESHHDLVHYIGHCDESGLRCPDGGLAITDLEVSNAQTFVLNACGSYYEGLELVEKGSVAGAVTFDKVLDRHAARVGTTFVRLLIRGTGAIPRPSGRGYAPSLWAPVYRSNGRSEFPTRTLIDRPPYRRVGIGRNGADSEPSYGGGLSAYLTRQYPKGQSVNAHARSVCLC
ncbi:hypothetical protein Hbor_13740 [Halogeometricum borinquense DSM 11551]|uniref:CHAT domain-containing protein n=2 Tax=Halogeometricum borinquense (strain ATCC 700274 / DSM 11551 / JCM 10706 / KCTC 4070 / PR3) TaxID=469382 RepID=E4NSG6_HALBP|nr:hypothetical protein Hbor_13740 [Halogeometricum borinquense DSM 11551]